MVQNHPERLAPCCQQTVILAVTSSPDAMSHKIGKTIAFCRGLRVDIHGLSPQLKSYY